MAWCNDGGQLFSALHNKIVIILPMYLREHKEKVQDANHFRCQTAWSHQLSLAPLCTRNGRNCRSKSPSLQSIRLSTTTNLHILNLFAASHSLYLIQCLLDANDNLYPGTLQELQFTSKSQTKFGLVVNKIKSYSLLLHQ
jgi:hypothetical protein